jgi:hypothetical protein
MNGSDVLHDRKPKTGAAVGSAARIVDPVEALEDTVELGSRNANAVVRDCDFDLIVDSAGLHMRRNDDPRPGVGIGDGILDQVADRNPPLAGVTPHPRPRSTGNR